MRIRWILATAVAVAAAFPSDALAGDGWRVVDTAGVVRVGGPGYMPVALTREQELPADSWIETASGRAVLVRGQETVIVEPNSRVQLPASPVNGNTQILQSLGSAIYKIGKQKKPHFQVDTPYLAAVVKGTAFTVKVQDDEASVTVTEGLVEVSTPDMQDVEFVRPGFTALVSRDNGSDIIVDYTRAEDTRGPEVPKNDAGSNQTVVIPKAIGDVELDVKEASSGLVTSDVVPVDSTSVKEDPKKDSSDAKGEGKPQDQVPADLGPPKDVSALDDSIDTIDVGPTRDVPGNMGIGDSIDPPADDVVDNIRGPGNGNALGTGHGKGPAPKPGPI
jgi:hypothetical protein